MQAASAKTGAEMGQSTLRTVHATHERRSSAIERASAGNSSGTSDAVDGRVSFSCASICAA